MMPFIYRYANQTPPAPFLLLNLFAVEGEGAIAGIPGQIDTGADRAVIPNSLVTKLGLSEVGRLICAGLAGQEYELAVYEVKLQIRDLAPIVARVAGSDGEPMCCLAAMC